MKLFLLIVKNIFRNKVRTALTGTAIIILVVIFSMIATILRFLDNAMTAKAADVPVVLTERYRFPSRFDRARFEEITEPGRINTELKENANFRESNSTLWHFIAFSLDPDKKDKDLQFFSIATYPERIPNMIDELQKYDIKKCELLKNPPNTNGTAVGVLMGPDRLATIKKKVGDVFQATSVSHRGIDPKTGVAGPIVVDVEIVGELPGDSRWSQNSFCDYRKLDTILHDWKSPMDGKIMLGWLKFDDQNTASMGCSIVEKNVDAIKSEVASTSIGRFLEPYKGILWGMKWVLAPSIAAVMILIVANAISITVRERTKEVAVLKVLGFRPGQILVLILGEGLLVGVICGLLGAFMTYGWINWIKGGLKFPIGFFGVFFIPLAAFWWGPILGAFTALVGGIWPAIMARSVKVSEVFAKVT